MLWFFALFAPPGPLFWSLGGPFMPGEGGGIILFGPIRFGPPGKLGPPGPGPSGPPILKAGSEDAGDPALPDMFRPPRWGIPPLFIWNCICCECRGRKKGEMSIRGVKARKNGIYLHMWGHWMSVHRISHLRNTHRRLSPNP